MLPGHPDDFKKRFETEAKLTAKLKHPNIIEIYAVGSSHDLPFIEMEYIEGESLDRFILLHGRLPSEVCCAVVLLIAEALKFAHSQEFSLYGKKYTGIIHRDLKPANIMISVGGVLKLMDFGVARPVEAGLHTMDGNIVGTLQYLAPEQLDNTAIDGRADIYSLGAILYELLCGSKVFPQESITTLLKTRTANQYRRLTEFDFPVEPTLGAICATCLNANRELRYANATELCEALRDWHNEHMSDTPENVLKQYIQDPEAFHAYANSSRNTSKTIKIPVSSIHDHLKFSGLAKAATLTFFLMISGIGVYIYIALKSSTMHQEPLSSASISGTLKDTVSSKEIISEKKQDTLATIPANVIIPVKNASQNILPISKPIQTHTMPQMESVKKTVSNTGSTVSSTALSPNTKPPALKMLCLDLPARSPQRLQCFAKQIAELLRNKKSAQAEQLLSLPEIMGISDGYLDVLRGQLAEFSNNTDVALQYYRNGITTPSIIKKPEQIRVEALYFSARLLESRYKITPTSDNRLAAENAWKAVLRMCSSANNGSHYCTEAQQRQENLP
jgi:serine/threonine protein kinase